MSVLKRSRFFFWTARELSRKYTKSFITGILFGFILMVILRLVFPFIKATKFSPVRRIGYIGEYTPTSLPITIQNQISFGLTTLSEDGSVKPGLAANWEVADGGKKYIFHFRSDINWHTGKAVTAKDVNYNIRSVTFETPDIHTLVAKLQNQYSPFLSLVSKPIFGTKLSGFGEYKVDMLRLTGEKITTLRIVSSTKASLPAYEYRFYRSETQAIIAYKLGEIDEIIGLTSMDADLKNWKNTKITEQTNMNRVVTVFFNLKDQLLRDKILRQALTYAIPDFGMERAYSPIAKSSWAYSDAEKHYAYDMKTAKKLLDSDKAATAAGELTIHTFSQYLPIAEKIAASWNTLGIKTNLQVENVIPDQYQTMLSALEIPSDPDQYIYWQSTQRDTNITGLSNAKIDKLLEDARVEPDQQARKKLYTDFQKRLIDELPAAFLFYPTSYTVERIK